MVALPDDAANSAAAPGQLALELEREPALSEDEFLVGEGNRLAYAHVVAFPDWAAPLTLIVGPPKSGKSHLARIWSTRSGALHATPASAGDLAAAGGRRPVLVEDVDRSGYGEPALFHLLNQSMRDSRPLLMTARTLVAAWPYETEDVRSRVRLAAVFSLASADDVQLSQVLVKLFADRQISVDPKVIAFAVARMERSPEEAVMLVALMDRLALSRHCAVNRAIAAEAIAIRQRHQDDAQLGLELDRD